MRCETTAPFRLLPHFPVNDIKPAEVEILYLTARDADKVMVMVVIRAEVIVKPPIRMYDLDQHAAR